MLLFFNIFHEKILLYYFYDCHHVQHFQWPLYVFVIRSLNKNEWRKLSCTHPVPNLQKNTCKFSTYRRASALNNMSAIFNFDIGRFKPTLKKNGRNKGGLFRFQTIHNIDIEVVPISDGPVVYCRAKSISAIRYHAVVHVHVHVNSCPCLGTSQYSCFRLFSHSCSRSCFMIM